MVWNNRSSPVINQKLRMLPFFMHGVKKDATKLADMIHRDII